MKLVLATILTVVGVLTGSPVSAETCDQLMAQNLNSRIEADLLLAETSESLDADGAEKITGLKEEFSEVSNLQTQALDSGDSTQLNDVCQRYREILAQLEELAN